MPSARADPTTAWPAVDAAASASSTSGSESSSSCRRRSTTSGSSTPRSSSSTPCLRPIFSSCGRSTRTQKSRLRRFRHEDMPSPSNCRPRPRSPASNRAWPSAVAALPSVSGGVLFATASIYAEPLRSPTLSIRLKRSPADMIRSASAAGCVPSCCPWAALPCSPRTCTRRRRPPLAPRSRLQPTSRSQQRDWR